MDDAIFTAFDWQPAIEQLHLLAPVTANYLRNWVQSQPEIADHILSTSVDPERTDTTVLTEDHQIPLSLSVNCVLVTGKREGALRHAAVCVRADTRADINGTVKQLLNVRKASFLPQPQAVEASQMEYGGINPFGLPEGFDLLLEANIADDGPAPLADQAGITTNEHGGWVMLGSGVRSAKVLLPGSVLAMAPGIQLVENLALPG